MSDEKKYTIIRIVFILFISILLILVFTLKKKPEEIIEKTFHFSLPATYKILNFDNNFYTSDFNVKILINDQDIEKIKKDVSSYFGQECSINDFNIPNIGKYVKWWDVGKGNIISFYMALVEGNNNIIFSTPKTAEIWVFLVQQNDGKYYLYISRF